MPERAEATHRCRASHAVTAVVLEEFMHAGTSYTTFTYGYGRDWDRATVETVLFRMWYEPLQPARPRPAALDFDGTHGPDGYEFPIPLF